MSTHRYYGWIPYHGESVNYCDFDSIVPISTAAIQLYCDVSKRFAEHVFSTKYNESPTAAGQNIRFSYFLWGEVDGSSIHEGVDVSNVVNSTSDIKSAHAGTIGGVRGGSYGTIQIYDPTVNYTMTYMHMSNVTSLPSVSVGIVIGKQSNVTGGSPIGNHLHIQAEYGENYYIASASNSTLESSSTYYPMGYHI